MLPKRDEKIAEIELLSLLASEKPFLGAGQAKGFLEMRGIHISEATAGRLLRDLELKGWVEKVARQGRRITPEGEKYLEAQQREREHLQSAEAFLESLKPKAKRELIDLLVARRAIEGETARLAATHASTRELEELRHIVAETHARLASRQSMAQEDSRFHLLIAHASENRVLEAALRLIWHNGVYSPVLEKIRHLAGSTTGSDHERVLKALENRDPHAAQEAMLIHLDNILRDVETQAIFHEEETTEDTAVASPKQAGF